MELDISVLDQDGTTQLMQKSSWSSEPSAVFGFGSKIARYLARKPPSSGPEISEHIEQSFLQKVLGSSRRNSAGQNF